MRILIISQYYPPDITAAAFRIHETAVLLLEHGHDLRVITAKPHKATVSGTPYGVEEDTKLRVVRCRVSPLHGRGVIPYLRHYLSFVVSAVSAGLLIGIRGWRPDIVFASSPPLFVGLAGRVLSVLFRRPLVLEIRDIWPDTAVAAGQLKDNSCAHRLGRRLERHLYRKSSHIICVSEPMKKYLRGTTETPASVVYNGVPQESIECTQPEVDSDRTADRTLLYTGNLGHVQNLDLAVRGFDELHKENQLGGWCLRLIGEGVQRENLEHLIVSVNAQEYIEILPPMARSDVFQELPRAGILLLILKSDITLERTIPSKLFDYLLASRPILGGIVGEGRSILESSGANRCFQPGDLADFKKQLSSLVADLNSAEALAPENRECVSRSFTREEAVARLQEVFKSVVNR